jgi:hypothetical protein
VFAVKVLQGIADGLGGSAQAAGDAPAHLGQGAARHSRHAPAAPHDLVFLRLRQLRKVGAALHVRPVGGQETVHHRLHEADLTPAVGQHLAAHQAAVAPARDRLGRDVQALADLLQRQHRLGDGLHRHRRRRPGQRLDQEAQVVLQHVALDEQVGVGVGAELGDPVTDELVRVVPARLDLGQKPLGTGQLFEALRRGREADLLLSQLFQGRRLELLQQRLDRRNLGVRHGNHSLFGRGSPRVAALWGGEGGCAGNPPPAPSARFLASSRYQRRCPRYGFERPYSLVRPPPQNVTANRFNSGAIPADNRKSQ